MLSVSMVSLLSLSTVVGEARALVQAPAELPVGEVVGEAPVHVPTEVPVGEVVDGTAPVQAPVEPPMLEVGEAPALEGGEPPSPVDEVESNSMSTSSSSSEMSMSFAGVPVRRETVCCAMFATPALIFAVARKLLALIFAFVRKFS